MSRACTIAASIVVAASAACTVIALGVGPASSAAPALTTADGAATASAPAVRLSMRATAPVPGACPTGAAALWSNLAACGWPGPQNTGYPPGSALRATSGRTITVDNSVVDGERVTGSLTIAAQNVVVRNSLIDYQGAGGGGSGGIKVLAGASAVIDHVEVDGNSAVHACVWHEGRAMSVNALHCHDVEDGIFAWAATGTPSSGDNFSITNSYLHGFNAVESNGHFDGFQTEGAANGVITHNTFDLPVGATGAISIWNSQKNTSNIAVEGNLLKGGGFTVYAQDYSPSEASPAGGFTMTDIRFSNNQFSNVSSACVGNFGVWFFRSTWTYQGGPTGGWGANGNTRSGNVIVETQRNVDQGNPPGCT